MKVEFTRPALTELDAIFAYIHQRNPVASVQVVARVREIASQLGRFPDMGHREEQARRAELIASGAITYD